MAIFKQTRRNVTILGWLMFPYLFMRNLPDFVKYTSNDVGHLIDTYRPFADYDGEGRGSSVREGVE